MDNVSKIKIGVCAASLVGSFAAGWFSHQPATITKTETITVEKFKDQVIVQDKKTIDHSVTTTVNKKPDGETTTTVVKTDVAVDSEKASQMHEESQTTQTTSSGPSASQEHDFALGLSTRFDFSKLPKPSYQIDAGRRLLGPFWLTGTVGLDSAAVGIRFEF